MYSHVNWTTFEFLSIGVSFIPVTSIARRLRGTLSVAAPANHQYVSKYLLASPIACLSGPDSKKPLSLAKRKDSRVTSTSVTGGSASLFNMANALVRVRLLLQFAKSNVTSVSSTVNGRLDHILPPIVSQDLNGP